VAVGSHEQQPWVIGHTHAAVGYVKLLRKPEGSIWMRPCGNLPSHFTYRDKAKQRCDVLARRWRPKGIQLLPAAIRPNRESWIEGLSAGR
jgi:hypothetical protein